MHPLKKSIALLSTLLLSQNTNAVNNADTIEKYHKTLDFIEQSGNDVYCYWDIKKEQHNVDWQQIIADAHQKITDNTTFSEFQLILYEIGASVHDGHVKYIYTGKNKVFYVPIEIKKIDNNYYLSKVEHEKFSPYDADLDKGDKVLALGGKDINQVIEDQSKFVSASTLGMMNFNAALSLNSLNKFIQAPEKNWVIKVQKYKTGEIKEVELPYLIYNTAQIKDNKLEEIVYSKILPGNIGLLTLSSMSYESDDEFIKYIANELEALKNTKALIIDVRNNKGGSGDIGDSVIAHFINDKVKRYKAQLKNSQQLLYARPDVLEKFEQLDPTKYQYSQWRDFPIEPVAEEKRYTKPVYILTNERCFSACDTFSDSFSSNHLGEVLGSNTGGGTGYPLQVPLPWNYGKFRFSVLRGYSNHDRYLEGVGTIPDVEIKTSPTDLYNNIDGELARAYNYVRGKLESNKGFTNYISKQDRTYFSSQDKSVVPYVVQEEKWQEMQDR